MQAAPKVTSSPRGRQDRCACYGQGQHLKVFPLRPPLPLSKTTARCVGGGACSITANSICDHNESHAATARPAVKGDKQMVGALLFAHLLLLFIFLSQKR